MAGNLNSGRSYLIAAVTKSKWFCKATSKNFKKNQIHNWTNKSQKPAESSYIHKWTMPHTVLFWRNRGSLCCFFLCSGRILTTAHIPWERYTMLLLLLPSCSSLYIPRLFYSNRPVIVHTGVTFFLKKHHHCSRFSSKHSCCEMYLWTVKEDFLKNQWLLFQKGCKFIVVPYAHKKNCAI